MFYQSRIFSHWLSFHILPYCGLLHPVCSACVTPQYKQCLVLSVVHPAEAAMATQVSSETPINAHQQKPH